MEKMLHACWLFVLSAMTPRNDFHKQPPPHYWQQEVQLDCTGSKAIVCGKDSSDLPAAWLMIPATNHRGHLAAHFALAEPGGFIRKSGYQRLMTFKRRFRCVFSHHCLKLEKHSPTRNDCSLA